MPQYLVANYLPDDFDPSTVTEAMIEEIHALNRELIAAGVRKFACGISPAANAKTLRKQPDGKVLVTDGPYTETKDYASYCTSCGPCVVFSGKRRRSESLIPCALRGGSGPGSSYSHMFLS